MKSILEVVGMSVEASGWVWLLIAMVVFITLFGSLIRDIWLDISGVKHESASEKIKRTKANFTKLH